MPGSQDPSFWQILLDSRFVQTIVSGMAMAVAVGAAVMGFLNRERPKTKADRDLKEELENGIPKILLKQVADELHGIREDVGDLRERVSKIEGYLERQIGGR